MSFGKYLTSYLDDSIDDSSFTVALKNAETNIRNVGLSEDEVNCCVQILLEKKRLSDSDCARLFSCLIPRSKIPEGTTNALVAWFFSIYSSEINRAKLFLSWLSVMLKNNLIETKPIEKLFNQFLFCFYYTELVPPVCQVLRHIIDPLTVTQRSVFLAQYFHETFVIAPEKLKIACLLRLFHASVPRLVPNPPSGKSVLSDHEDEFSKSVSMLAFQLGFSSSLPLNKKPTHQPQYPAQYKINHRRIIGAPMTINWNDLPTATAMRHLGRMIKNDMIPPINSIAQLLEMKMGQIFLCWLLITGCELPPEDEVTVLPSLSRLLEVCQRSMTGIPSLPTVLKRYFILWDGEHNEKVIFDLLSWVHYDSFEDLYANVLCHIVNIYFTKLLPDKIRIINCFNDLISNKVTTAPIEATIKLISFVETLIKVALAQDFNSVGLLFAGLKFYLHVSCLEERYKLKTWTIPSPYVIFGAFLSKHHALISLACELVVRHNAVMYPFYIQVGLIEHFKEEEDIIKTYLRDLYFFLWKGKASGTELIASEEDNMDLENDVDDLLTVRNHYGINTLFTFIQTKVEMSSVKSFNDKSKEKILKQYAPGILEIKELFES